MEIKDLLTKEELELLNNPETLKVYLDFKLEVLKSMNEETKLKLEAEKNIELEKYKLKLKAEAEENDKRRIAEAEERKCRSDFWTSMLIGAGVLCDYISNKGEIKQISHNE